MACACRTICLKTIAPLHSTDLFNTRSPLFEMASESSLPEDMNDILPMDISDDESIKHVTSSRESIRSHQSPHSEIDVPDDYSLPEDVNNILNSESYDSKSEPEIISKSNDMGKYEDVGNNGKEVLAEEKFEDEKPKPLVDEEHLEETKLEEQFSKKDTKHINIKQEEVADLTIDYPITEESKNENISEHENFTTESNESKFEDSPIKNDEQKQDQECEADDQLGITQVPKMDGESDDYSESKIGESENVSKLDNESVDTSESKIEEYEETLELDGKSGHTSESKVEEWKDVSKSKCRSDNTSESKIEESKELSKLNGESDITSESKIEESNEVSKLNGESDYTSESKIEESESKIEESEEASATDGAFESKVEEPERDQDLLSESKCDEIESKVEVSKLDKFPSSISSRGFSSSRSEMNSPTGSSNDVNIADIYEKTCCENEETPTLDDFSGLDNLSLEQLQGLGREEMKRRKASESDIVLLRNRITHLRNEFDVANKRVGDTRARIDAIKSQKQNRLEKRETISMVKSTRMSTMEQESIKINQSKEQARKKREEAFRKQLNDKKSTSQHLQKEKERLLEVKRQQEEQWRRDKEEKRLNRLNEIKLKKEEEERNNERRRLQKESTKRKQLEETQRICEEREKEVEELEQLELQLINDLREAQLKQSESYQALETTLTQPSEC